MQNRLAKKAPYFFHTHLVIKVNISEENMGVPHPGFGYIRLFSLILFYHCYERV